MHLSLGKVKKKFIYLMINKANKNNDALRKEKKTKEI